MKKFFLVLLIMTCSVCAFAQEYNGSVGLGPEWNMNSRHGFAGGVGIGFDYNLPGYFAAGFSVTASDNFSGFRAIEPVIKLRYYFPETGYTGPFAQLEAGVFIIDEDCEDGSNNTEIMPKLSMGGGYRLPVGSTFYVEPYGRLGYPFAFGIGVMAGFRF